ncbi:MAG: alpha/beta hydrolase domain-containing protein, partial [Sulfurifustis sp.]
DGSDITGRVRGEYIVSAPISTQNLSSGFFTALTHLSYETVSLDNNTAMLTKRVKESDVRIPVPNGDWAFADCTSVAFPGTPSTTQICLKDGFSPNFIYELLYTAKNPTVLGLGFAATRDLISFLRDAEKDEAGNPNPLAHGIRTALAHGTSQSGRYVRTFLALGFNRDERGGTVFDGMNPHLATLQIPLNVRFGQPGRGYGQHEDHLYPAAEPPFTYPKFIDSIAHEHHGILDECRRTRSCPKIIQTVSSTEYWQGRMSLDTTDVRGRLDVPEPANVRFFHLAGTQHVPAAAPAAGICQQLSNPNPYREGLRALLTALREWVVTGVEPPGSRIPTLQTRTLVHSDAGSIGWPNLPGVKYTGLLNELALLDFGRRFDADDETGVIDEPPRIRGAEYTVLVPKVDADGNEVAGLRSVTLQAPLGTYTGWNLRRAGFAEDEVCGLTGSFIPFARTKAQRESNGDPRPSLEERYGTHDGYVAAVRAAANRLVAQRLLLGADAERLITQAEASSVLK